MSLTARQVLTTLAVMVSLATLLSALIAVPVLGAEVCPNEQLRVENKSTDLPQCRAYEQVTPVEKQGGVFELEHMGRGPGGSPDLLVSSFATLDGAQGSDETFLRGVSYSNVLTGSGWVTSPVVLPASEYQGGEFSPTNPQAASLDARSTLWLDRLRSGPKNRIDLFIAHPGPLIEDMGPLAQPSSLKGEFNFILLTEYAMRGWSDDLSHVVYGLAKDHWPFDTTSEGDESLYEYVGTGNTEPMLVGVDEAGKLISDCGTNLGGMRVGSSRQPLTNLSAHNAVSADGDTVFFTADKCGSSPAAYELFARIDNGQPDAHTVAISEPSAEDCASCDTSGPENADFVGASTDGTKAFFVTEQPLLGGDHTNNIYEYDFSAPPGERVIRVSGGDSTVSDPTAAVQGVVATSEDGSHVYFVAHGVLTTTPDSRGLVAQAGADNLYVFERDAQDPGRTAFIAGLTKGDEAMWKSGGVAQLTPDGRFLVFTSADDLTPDDTSTVAQVFAYNTQTGNLVRVSVGQNGYNDNGNTDVAPASIPINGGSAEASVPTAYLSNLSVAADGTVFFESTDGLTPQALDHQVIGKRYEGPEEHPEEKFSLVYGNNVYEYHDGNVYLISDGQDISLNSEDNADVKLLGTDESGEDVFFTTVDQLVPQDIDTDIDIYDARVDGGFPAPVMSPECSGDGCQGPLSPTPTLLSPGSEFQAGGNPPLAAPAPAPKPKAKKAVKPETKKKKRARKASRKRRKVQRHGKETRS